MPRKLFIYTEEPLTDDDKSVIEGGLDMVRQALIEQHPKDIVKHKHGEKLKGKALAVSNKIHKLQSKVWEL